DESERFELLALEAMERCPSDDPRHRFGLTNSYQHLAWHYYSTDKYDKAEPFYDKALALCNSLVKQSPEVDRYRRTLGFIHTGRGNLYFAQGRTADAEAAHQEGVRVREKLARDSGGEPDALHHLAWSYDGLSGLYEQTGRRELAEPLREKALAI